MHQAVTCVNMLTCTVTGIQTFLFYYKVIQRPPGDTQTTGVPQNMIMVSRSSNMFHQNNMFLICINSMIFIKKKLVRMRETCTTRSDVYIKNVFLTTVGCNLFSRSCDQVVTCSNHGSNLANKKSQ